MSSRNQYLSADERKSATCLYEALQIGRAMIKNKIRNVSLIKKEMSNIIQSNLLAKMDYIEIVDPETLEPVKKIKGQVAIVLAVFIGKTRLIDNMVIG